MAGKGSGNYYESTPLDFELLRRMPDEGSVLGYHTIAATVPHLRRELNKSAPKGGELASSTISSRIRSMHVAGMCVKVRVMGGDATHGWQRTEKGKQFLADNTPAGLTLVGKEEAHAAAGEHSGN